MIEPSTMKQMETCTFGNYLTSRLPPGLPFALAESHFGCAALDFGHGALEREPPQ